MLPFAHPEDPFFGLAKIFMVRDLFSLHFFYSGTADDIRRMDYMNQLADARVRGGKRHFSATPEMRSHLRWLMELTIEKDAQRALKAGAAEKEVNTAVRQARKSIIDPQVNTDDLIEVDNGKLKIFNANFFNFSEVSKLIRNAMINEGKPVTVDPEEDAMINEQRELVRLAAQYMSLQVQKLRSKDYDS